MPHLAPLYWPFISLSTIFILISLMIFIYYFISNSPNKSFSHSMMNSSLKYNKF